MSKREGQHRRAQRAIAVLMNLQTASEESGLPYTSFRDLVVQGHLPRVQMGDSTRIWIRRADLESRPALKYMGTYQQDFTYSEANLVTKNGALWIALRSTTQTPGQSGDWKMIVKSGGA